MIQYKDKKPASTCFRRWANTAYAVFNSLHKCVKIGVLCVVYTMLTSPAQCFAQIDSAQLKRIDLEEVEVNAEATPDVFAPIGRTITQVRKTDIERAAVQSLTDLLDFIPGVDLRQRGPYGAQADLSIRGASFDQTLVLLNGINISDPQTGHYSLNLPIDIESVEKIEILEGPAARIFGTNALGGAVNFITGTQPTNSVTASVAGGQYGFYRAALSGTLHTQRTTHHMTISNTASSGYMHNTAFDNINAFTQNKWKNRHLPLDLQIGYTQKHLGANSFYGPKYPDQYERLHTFFASLKGSASAGKFKITPAAYWRRNYDQYILNRNNPDAYRNFHRTDVYGADVTAELAERFGRTVAGILVRGEHIYSNNLGNTMTEPRRIIRQDDKWYTKSDQRTNISAFAEQNLHIGRWSASAGVLANINSYTGNRLNIYPGVDVNYRPGRTVRIYASANRAMRLPTFTDLYYQSPMNIGNPELKPEHSTEYELGVKITKNSYSAGISYFYRNISNAIDWIWLDAEQKWHTLNLTELHMHGMAAGGTWDVTHSAGERFPLQRIAVHYTFMNGNKSSSQYKSNYVMDYMRHRLSIGITHRIAGNVNAHWSINRQERNGGYMKLNSDGSETETPYEAFWQTDLRVYMQRKWLNIFAEASNIGNRMHQDIGNITLPGRWIRAGITVKLEARD